MSLRLPPSWERMSDHARAVYLCDTFQAKGYSQARRAVGREKRRAKVAALSVQAYQAGLEKMKLA